MESVRQQPRRANGEEVNDLVQYWDDRYGVSETAARLVIEGAYTAVFDRHIIEGPGYRGKLMMVAWRGDPSLYDCFVWSQGKMVRLGQSTQSSVGSRL